MTNDMLLQSNPAILEPWYQTHLFHFIIGDCIGLVGAFIAYKALRAAKGAEIAAKQAGEFVKIQTIIIDLTELIQRLDNIERSMGYERARNFYSEINRRIRRIVAAYSSDENYSVKISEIKNLLINLKNSLGGVRPDGVKIDVGDDVKVYNAIEGDFVLLSGALAELCGLFETHST